MGYHKTKKMRTYKNISNIYKLKHILFETETQKACIIF